MDCFACARNDVAGLHPSPVFVGRVAHRERSDTMCRVGGLSDRAHPHMAPHPGLRFAVADPPH